MDPLTLFGLFAVTAMLVCYALEDRNRLYILAFAGACALGSIYGFLQGAWPFGIVEFAARRWWLRGKSFELSPKPTRHIPRPRQYCPPMGRLLGQRSFSTI